MALLVQGQHPLSPLAHDLASILTRVKISNVFLSGRVGDSGLICWFTWPGLPSIGQ